MNGFKARFRMVCVAMTCFNLISFCSLFKMASILHAFVLPNGAEVAIKFVFVALSLWFLPDFMTSLSYTLDYPRDCAKPH